MCLLAQTMYAQNGGSKEGYVDLGLSVKWATCNLGASKPEEYGIITLGAKLRPRRPMIGQYISGAEALTIPLPNIIQDHLLAE